MKKITTIALSAVAVCAMMGLASCNKTENQQKADQAQEQIDEQADAMKEAIDEKADAAKEVVEDAANTADSLEAANAAEQAVEEVK